MPATRNQNSALETNPFLPSPRSNIGTPDPLAPNAQPIPPVYLSMPKKFSFEQWKEKLVDAPRTEIPKAHQLSTNAENLLTPFLSPLHNELQNIAEDTAIKISEEKVGAREWTHKIAKTENLLREMFTKQLNAVNARITPVLAAFDDNTNGFKTNFMAAISETNEDKARKALETRLKQEQEKINNQNELEKEIIGAINEWRMFHANMRYVGEIQRMVKGEGAGISVKSLKSTEVPDNVTFVPGEGKKFNLLDAFFKGTWTATIYSIKDGKHTFNPKDPDACKTFINFARAQNDGETTQVTIRLGGGTRSDYSMYGTLTPDTSRVLHERAMYFMATLKHGLEDIPSKNLTKESVIDYYRQYGTVPDELKTVDLEMPPIPHVTFKESTDGKEAFHPTPADEKEFTRWRGIREALIQCRLEEIEKFIEKIKTTPEENLTQEEQEKLAHFSTLRSDFNTQLRRLERLDAAPTQVPDSSSGLRI